MSDQEEKMKPSEIKADGIEDGRRMAWDDDSFQNLLDSSKFEHMQRVAELFADSDLIPEHFQGKPANCFIALQMALRLQIDPYMLMNKIYIIHGRPAMEAQIAIALVNNRGPFKGPIQWRFEGQGRDEKCTAFATHLSNGELCEATVTWMMVEANGWHLPRGQSKQPSPWVTSREQKFCYESALYLARRYCPEVLLGMRTIDEIEVLLPDASTPARRERQDQRRGQRVPVSTSERKENHPPTAPTAPQEAKPTTTESPTPSNPSTTKSQGNEPTADHAENSTVNASTSPVDWFSEFASESSRLGLMSTLSERIIKLHVGVEDPNDFTQEQAQSCVKLLSNFKTIKQAEAWCLAVERKRNNQ